MPGGLEAAHGFVIAALLHQHVAQVIEGARLLQSGGLTRGGAPEDFFGFAIPPRHEQDGPGLPQRHPASGTVEVVQANRPEGAIVIGAPQRAVHGTDRQSPISHRRQEQNDQPVALEKPQHRNPLQVDHEENDQCRYQRLRRFAPVVARRCAGPDRV